MTARPRLLLVLTLALTAPACGGEDPAGAVGSGPGTATQAQADEAMGGLCELTTGDLTAMADAHEAFHGKAHEALHAVAAEAQQVDAIVAGALLEAKAVVEADLEAARPPEDLPEHARALAVAFGEALEAIGLRAAACAEA